MGERELAEDTGLARSAYMSSESALRTELLLDDADDTDDTLLTLSDLQQELTGFPVNTQNTIPKHKIQSLNNNCHTWIFCRIFQERQSMKAREEKI